MSQKSISDTRDVEFSVREGSFLYVLVHSDGSTSTIPVDQSALDRGRIRVRVLPEDRIIEIALKSTSDPDLDPARGQIWPEETL